jgi:hypothetical protein
MMRRWRSRVRDDRGDGAVRLRIAAMVAFEATIRVALDRDVVIEEVIEGLISHREGKAVPLANLRNQSNLAGVQESVPLAMLNSKGSGWQTDEFSEAPTKVTLI